MERSSEGAHEEEAVLFSPNALALMSESGGVYKSSKVMVLYRDRRSAFLVLLAPSGESQRRLVLDLAASVQRERKDIDDEGNFSSFKYSYSRHGVNLEFEATPWWWGEEDEREEDSRVEDANESINAFEFIMSQFTFAMFSAAKVGVNEDEIVVENEHEHNREADQEEIDASSNNVAYGLEVTGKGLRTGLRATGRGVGIAIRYVGSAYTQVAVKLGAGGDGPRAVSEEDLAQGQKHKENCEVFHAGARSVTGTILAPVRYLGQKAGQMAPEADRSKTYDEDQGGAAGKERSAAEEVMWGAGNGFVHMFKGVTEFVSEIGAAVGDSAIYHSRMVNGEDYASRVTALHIEGAGQVGLGLYKVGHVMSFGIAGIAADALFEGATLLTALYDFLVGPVLLHAWMDVCFPPSTTLQRLYVVLRPFSVSFYEKSTQFAARPFRIIPTALLDTIPQLRLRGPQSTPTRAPTGAGDAATAGVSESGPLANTSSISQALASGAASSTEDLVALEERDIASQGSYVQRLTSMRSHVELCTVDCSSALLHPLVERETPPHSIERSSPLPKAVPVPVPVPAEEGKSGDGDEDAEDSTWQDTDTLDGAGDHDVEANERGEAALQEWFEELKAACMRVEEVTKKRSGALELALTRRLGLLPKKNLYWFTLSRLEVKSEKSHGTGGESGGTKGTSNSNSSSSSEPNSRSVSVDVDAASEGPEQRLEQKSSGIPYAEEEKQEEDVGDSFFSIDKLTAATMTRARVRVTPVCTDRGVHVSSEEKWTEYEPLESVYSGQEAAKGEFQCSYRDTRIELGHIASLKSGSPVDGVASILLTVKVCTMLGRSNAELGRCYIPISDLKEGEATKMTVKLHKKGNTRRVVGSLSFTAGYDKKVEEEVASL